MEQEPIKIGVLFSQTGPMAVTENAHLQGTLLACEEVNSAGGINGRLLDPVILNPEGDNRRYAELAAELLLKHRVNTIFGCCLSTSRKAVLPIVERYNGVLFYPSVYEGFEYSPNVIYGGAVPNQMILPLLEYVFKHHGKRIALIGSDTLYAREINRIVQEFLASSGGTTINETYLPFGASIEQMESELRNISQKAVDIILSTVVGEDSVALYEAHANLSPSENDAPFASLTTTESELAKMSASAREGHLSVASYFSTVSSPLNDQFVGAFTKRFGKESVPGVYSEVCYSLVHFFANAASISGSTDTEPLLEALSGAVFKGPGGDLSIDIDTNHFNLRPLIGKSLKDGTFEIVSKNPSVVRADPYLVAYDRTVSGHMAV